VWKFGKEGMGISIPEYRLKFGGLIMRQFSIVGKWDDLGESAKAPDRRRESICRRPLRYWKASELRAAYRISGDDRFERELERRRAYYASLKAA